MSILVTGATGFIGRHLLERLHGRDVVALARSAPPADLSDAAEWIEADLSAPLRTSALPERLETVVHLAQSPRYRDFPEGTEDVVAVNVDATAALADYARRAGARRFVLCSTGGVYGFGDQPAHEDATPVPAGFYAASKYAAELLVAQYRDFLAPVILRPFFVYGATQRGMLVASLAARVLAGEPVTVQGETGPRLNPTHVTDAARAIEAALSFDDPAVVNVAGDEPVTIAELVQLIAAAAEVEPRLVREGAAGAGNLMGDNARMKALLGVTPETPLATGLRGVVDELRAVT